MAGFIDSVVASFARRSPTSSDRKAAAEVGVVVGRKLLESLVEVGLREAFAHKFTLRRLELVSLSTERNRVATVAAHVSGRKFVGFKLTMNATIELRENVSRGLTLYFHEIRAKGRRGVIDSLVARVAHWKALDELNQAEVPIDSVKLGGTAVRRLEISDVGPDDVRIIVELTNADLREAL